MRARIAEVFDSIQGEGLYLGKRQLFIRFFGCNLSCKFCDTKLNKFKEYHAQELYEEIKDYKNNGFHSLSFTGGEPLLHKDFLKQLLQLTRGDGHKKYLETNGTLSGELKEVIDDLDIIAMDLKFPSSTGMGILWGLHRKFLKIASIKEVFLKAIICLSSQQEDLKEAISLIKEIKNDTVLVLQPNYFEEGYELSEKIKGFAEICKQENINCRIIPQMHKKMGVR